MKKLLFIFFTLIIFANISYASFPVSDTLKVKQDTLQTEEIKQYHSNLIKMGIDLNDCRCESCRNSIAPLTNNRGVNKPKKIWLTIIITITVLSAILLILFPIKIGISSKAFSEFG